MNGPFDDEYGWGDEDDMMDNNGMMPGHFGFGPPGPNGPPGPGDFKNRRYRNAYGNYRGGYGPGGGFGPPCPPPMPFGPPPLMPPPAPFMWGRGFGPNGPPGPPRRRPDPNEKTMKYLISCGMPKDTLKNLPRQMLRLMQPSYCGLCSIALESYGVARMHYLSKNHTKNQKKWLTNHAEIGYGRKEIPLKARDLYCELCDVHITSKSHADSHYAGKAHRAVVEGRKVPKNPFLLQKANQGRLETLIRREKKFIKTEETESPEENKEAAKVPPELYCDICKTAVTCSEQMTMHLNGKRHLNKEKNHILKMMTDKSADNDDDEKEDVEEVEGEEEEEEDEVEVIEDESNAAPTQDAEEAQAVGGDKKDDDWGNGSGVWD